MRVRALFWLTLAFTVGIAAERFWPWLVPNGPAPPILIAAGLITAFCLSLTARRVPGFALFILSFFCLGALAGNLASPHLPAPESMERYLDQPDTLFLAEVSSPPEYQEGVEKIPLRLLCAYGDGKEIPIEGGALLNLREDNPVPGAYAFGDMLLARLTLKRFHNFENPGGFDYQRAQAEKELFARAFAKSATFIIKVSPAGEPFLSRTSRKMIGAVDRFRQNALFWLKRNLDPDKAEFFGALLLGYRVSKEWAEHLDRTGLTHLVRVAGLHLGMVSVCVFWIACRLIRLLCPRILRKTSDREIALWAAGMAAVFYALVSGLSLSTGRAIVMLALFLGGSFWYRYSDPLTSVAAAALVILLFSPNSLSSISFLLSFASMFGIFMVHPRLEPARKKLIDSVIEPRRAIRKLTAPFYEAFWVSLAISTTVMPILVYDFHSISVAGFFANAILVPIVGFLVLPPGLAALAIYTVSENAALPVIKAAGWVLGLCQWMIVKFSELSWAFFWVGVISLTALALYYAGLGVLISRMSLRRKAGALLATLLVFGGFEVAGRVSHPRQDAHVLRADIIDVGQGSSALLRFPTGETMLVDGGGFYDDSYDIGRFVVAPFLWTMGIGRLDTIVLSHDHPDHRNGLRFVMANFDVGCFWESGVYDGPRGYDELGALAARRKIPVKRLSDLSRTTEIGNCVVHLLHPTEEYLRTGWDGDLNNASLVLDIQYGHTHVVLPGDAGTSVEEIAFHALAEDESVLLVSPHHGSDHSNSAALFDRLHPRAVVVSCGYDNIFGFPGVSVRGECAKRNIPLYRTDLNGAVHAESDGRQWTITSEQIETSRSKKLKESKLLTTETHAVPGASRVFP